MSKEQLPGFDPRPLSDIRPSSGLIRLDQSTVMRAPDLLSASSAQPSKTELVLPNGQSNVRERSIYQAPGESRAEAEARARRNKIQPTAAEQAASVEKAILGSGNDASLNPIHREVLAAIKRSGKTLEEAMSLQGDAVVRFLKEYGGEEESLSDRIGRAVEGGIMSGIKDRPGRFS